MKSGPKEAKAKVTPRSNRGRKPKPTALKIFEGNPGNRPLPDDEPKPEVRDLQMPKWLDDEGQSFWNEYAPMLAKMGVLTEADRTALTLAAQAWSDWKHATDELKSHGATIPARHCGVMMNPHIRIRANAEDRLKHWMTEFGLSPVARTRVKAIDTKKGDGVEEEFFGNKGKKQA